MFKQMKKKQEGFTLVELIVVITILGILATLLVPNIMGNIEKSKKNTAIANARTIASEITTYNAMQDDPTKKIGAKTIAVPADFALVHVMSAADCKTMTDAATIVVDANGNATATPK